MMDCPNCQGTGMVPADEDNEDGLEIDCPECDGTGEVDVEE